MFYWYIHFHELQPPFIEGLLCSGPCSLAPQLFIAALRAGPSRSCLPPRGLRLGEFYWVNLYWAAMFATDLSLWIQLWKRQRWSLPPWSSQTLRVGKSSLQWHMIKPVSEPGLWTPRSGFFLLPVKKFTPRLREILRGPWLCFTIIFTFFSLSSRVFVSVLLREGVFQMISSPSSWQVAVMSHKQISEEWPPMADSSTLVHLWLTDFL